MVTVLSAARAVSAVEYRNFQKSGLSVIMQEPALSSETPATLAVAVMATSKGCSKWISGKRGDKLPVLKIEKPI
ncbi:hypothetical protein GCM10009096_00440 [Parasphingorhabdus litoris]|uniref:Uncharacterized protein n=1 Tax=Parasphingorhabdus litoris TaxID=394733 RepID=A0ABN0ZZL0_9SPHN